MNPNDIRRFNEAQKKLYWEKTKIAVDIENLGKNTQCIAVREKPFLTEVYPHVWFKKECQEFSEGNFTNIYDVSWDPRKQTVQAQIHSSNTPYFLVDQIEKDPSAVAVINGGFFFLTDIADRTPLDLPYDLCIRDGQVYGLPSLDMPAAYVKGGSFDVKELKAEGTVRVGSKTLHWVGARTGRGEEKQYNAVLYNSRCSDVVKVRDENNIQIGILDNTNITTPTGTSVLDIVVARNDKSELVVTHINLGGGTHFFDGLFILQVKGSNHSYKVGDIVQPLTLDTLSLEGITAAMTVGRSVHNPFFLEDVRVERRDARSIIAKDTAGNFHFIVFDGSKYVPGFRGVSAKDISSYFSPERFEWAYFLDGGGSTRIIVRNENELQFVANEFAFRKLGGDAILWDWKKARLLTSSILLRQNKVK